MLLRTRQLDDADALFETWFDDLLHTSWSARAAQIPSVRIEEAV
jgi:hypothetical protein